MKPVDELLIARHSSGLRLTVAPNFGNGALCVWIGWPETDHYGGMTRLFCRYSTRARLAKWLRETADKVGNS